MKKKLVRTLLLVLALTFLLTSCNSSADPTQATTAAEKATTKAEADDEETKAEEETKAADETQGEEAQIESDYDEHITISQFCLDVEKTGNTERDKWYFDKFNVTFDFVPVTWGDWTEKVRAVIAGDDLPDILFWDMKLNHTAEFRTWAAEGAFREIGDTSRWPDLQAVRDKLVSDDEMLTVDGKLYGWPAFRNTPEGMASYYPVYAYRRDWAKELGLYKENDQYTWDEVFEMLDAVIAEDPGGNGAGNTFGITSEAWAFPGVFMQILGYSDDRSPYVMTDDGFVPYFTTDAWRNEVKFCANMFRDGYVWKDQLVVSGSEGFDNFKAGRSFMFLGQNSPSWFSTNMTAMVETGTIESTDDVGPMMVFSPADDKTFTLVETEDYWTVSNLAYHVDDAKYERIMEMWNWNASEDGRAFQVAGIEGKDYNRVSPTEIEVLWSKTADDQWDSPYKDTGTNYCTPPVLAAAPNETTNMTGFDAFDFMHEFMATSPDYYLSPLNWQIETFGGPQFSQFGSFGSETTEFIKTVYASSDDIDSMIDSWLAEMAPKWQPVADELTAAFG